MSPANRSARAAYNRDLQKLVAEINSDVRSSLIGSLKSFEPEYIADAYAETLNLIIRGIGKRYRDIDSLATQISKSMVNDVDNKNRTSFYKAMNKAVGINLNSIIAEEGLNDILQSKVIENVGLIQSIPDEYFKKLITIVNEGTTRGKSAGGITKEIFKLGKTTKKRARLIARDQTQKLNSAISQNRQQNLGIEEYRWRTVGDEDVRDTHKSKNGKVFRWDKPPKDTGHPGEDIQCRCIAEPIIKL